MLHTVDTAILSEQSALCPCSEGGITEDAERDADFTVPLRFRVSGSPNGKPDLQLQLLRLNIGAAARSSSGRSKHGSRKLLAAPTIHGMSMTIITSNYSHPCPTSLRFMSSNVFGTTRLCYSCCKDAMQNYPSNDNRTCVNSILKDGLCTPQKLRGAWSLRQQSSSSS